MIRSNLCIFWKPDVSLEICRGLDNQPSKSCNLQPYYFPLLYSVMEKINPPFLIRAKAK